MNELPIIHENDVEELNLPGRDLRWIVSPKILGAKKMSVCIIRVAPGETVRPAHAHPEGEETIYIIKGRGEVLIDGKTGTVTEGTAVLFPRESVHMLRNTGTEEMKVICFFAPAADVSTYRFFEDVVFPD